MERGALDPQRATRRRLAFSMYGLLDKAPGGVGYATTTIHRMLSDLTFILVGEGDYRSKNTNVVLGGDLNISVQCDAGRSSTGFRFRRQVRQGVAFAHP